MRCPHIVRILGVNENAIASALRRRWAVKLKTAKRSPLPAPVLECLARSAGKQQ